MRPGWGTSILWRQLGRMTALVSPHVERIERVTRTAERVSGIRRTEFALRSSLVKVHSRKLIQLHDVVPASDPSAGMPLVRIFDKCAARSNEYRFYRIISGQQMVGGPISPTLYAAWKAGFGPEHRRYTILMECLPRRGLSNLSAATAHCLAERIGDISTIQRGVGFEDKRTGAMSDDLLSSFVTRADEAGEMSDPASRDRLAAMIEGWKQVQAIAERELPLIPSHNDLAPRNTCQLGAEGGAPRFVFIDWEAFGLNYAGADLHHFLRLAIAEPAYASFFQELRRHYLERMRDLHGFDGLATDVGAHTYALYRSMIRAVKKKRAAELHIATEIYAKLKPLLDLTSPEK